MKIILCDVDGTLTDMWPIERSVLSLLVKESSIKLVDKLYDQGVRDNFKIYNTVSKIKIKKSAFYSMYNKAFLKLVNSKKLPDIPQYHLVNWILKNKDICTFLYATGGQKPETEYVLRKFKIIKYFDLINSISKTNCKYSKFSGVPLKRICKIYKIDAFFTDSEKDILGARKAGIKNIIQITKKDKKIRLFD